jgi:hypothetical protein
MSETPFELQRAKLRSLRAKQDAGEAPKADQHISPKAQARRNAEMGERAVKASKKVSKKKAGAVTAE